VAGEVVYHGGFPSVCLLVVYIHAKKGKYCRFLRGNGRKEFIDVVKKWEKIIV